MRMGVARPAAMAPGYPPDRADHAQATLNLLEDFVEERQQLKDTQLAVLNILEDATTDRLSGELRAREPGRAVRFAIHDGVRVTADRSLIRTVLQNLVENAWKFTAKRQDATIEFGTTATGDTRICCYVRDNGAGFDPAFTGKLFQPFQRLHAVTEFPGTGIGLASVQRIIERHGGRVWAEGAVGQGATFYFTLNPAPAP
jgi:signal transduction histidine kinase